MICVVKAEEEKRAIIRANYPQHNQITFIKVSVKLDWFWRIRFPVDTADISGPCDYDETQLS